MRLDDGVRHPLVGVGFFANALFEAPTFLRIARALELAPEVDEADEVIGARREAVRVGHDEASIGEPLEALS